MRTTIIPAQITSVEDKIAGSLNLTQILILLTPILWTGTVYCLFSPQLKLTAFKLALTIIGAIFCSSLAIRIKGKVLISWLGILILYRLRPKYYLFNKNDSYNREIDPLTPTRDRAAKHAAGKSVKKVVSDLKVSDLVKFEELVSCKKIAVSYQFGKKRL